MNYFLGVDGGATKTTAWLADESGQIVAKTTVGPTNITLNLDQAKQNLRLAINQVKQQAGIQNINRGIFGLSGLDSKQDLELAHQYLSPLLTELEVLTFQLINDLFIIPDSVEHQANFVVVIAGTGSNCFGENAAGETVHAGGYDYLLDDAGSAYEVGLKVLKAVMKSYDGRLSATQLTNLVMAHFAVDELSELKNLVYSPPLTKSQIAQLAELCNQAAMNDDGIAQDLLLAAAEEISQLVKAVAQKLWPKIEPEFDLIVVGSLSKSLYFFEQLELIMKGTFPQVRMISPDQPPVLGAVKMASSVK